jgi:hypothetical protein
VDIKQWAVDSRQWAEVVGSKQWAGSKQWILISGQWKVGFKQLGVDNGQREGQSNT